jgi:4-amino-4-deoxy-L-arabinose transferase-like glycosyltransferase
MALWLEEAGNFLYLAWREQETQTQTYDKILKQRSSIALHIGLLLALCGVLYLPYLGALPFFDRGEPREALAVQDIVQRGEWLFPLKTPTTIPSKPPLFHWSAALTSKITGKLDERTIRFPSAFYAILGVITIYWLGRKLFGAQVGLLAGAILSTTLLYSSQALNARVDMTLCFFLTFSLVLFYLLYRGFVTRPLWYYLFYAVVGIGALAKGPLGILLPALVAGAFLAIKRRWDLLFKFCFHPGGLLTVTIAAGWYGVAAMRGGEDFVDRQLLKENLERFFGGSGHSNPVYYYIPYLFFEGLPWSLFLPFVLWDYFKKRSVAWGDDGLFLTIWLGAMFGFFSLSMGKRPVYLVPVYPAMALLTAAWFYQQGEVLGMRRFWYRLIALIAGWFGIVLLVITLGGLWNHDPGWFFSLIEPLLKPKDRANLLAVRESLVSFGWAYTVAACLSGILWLATASSLWMARIRLAAYCLVLGSILVPFIGWSMVLPAIAETKSYRQFMEEVNRRVEPSGKLYLFGELHSDPIVYYRGMEIETLERSMDQVATQLGTGDVYIIMAQQTWSQMAKLRPTLAAPLLKSKGTGPEGDLPIVLVRASGV